jgi:hypothetical protein
LAVETEELLEGGILGVNVVAEEVQAALPNTTLRKIDGNSVVMNTIEDETEVLYVFLWCCICD